MRDLAVVVSNANKNVTVYETIDAIKEAGFNNVFIQWYNKKTDPSQEKQLEYINKLGLNVIFAHLGYKDINLIWKEDKSGDLLVEQYKKDLDICKKNNINMVVMHLTSEFEAPPYGKTGLKRIKKITKYAKKLGIKVAFENTKIKGYLDYIITNIKCDNVGICFDSGHYHVHFDDDFNFELYKDRIFAIHLHDNDKSYDQHLTPYDGTIDWDFLIKQLKECNYNGPITLELCYRNNYLNIDIKEFYKTGYKIAKKISDKFDEK